MRLSAYTNYSLRLLMYLAVKENRDRGLATIGEVAERWLDDVVRQTQPDMALVPCFNPVNAPCAIRSCCVLRKALQNAADAFLAALDDYSLDDLA